MSKGVGTSETAPPQASKDATFRAEALPWNQGLQPLAHRRFLVSAMTVASIKPSGELDISWQEVHHLLRFIVFKYDTSIRRS
jgi:hypothetical protein